MKLTFVSNYINHHQIPVSQEFYRHLKDDYHFVETEPMEEERIRQGWNPDTASLPFVVSFLKEPEACRRLISDSDVVIYGGVEDESFIEKRIDDRKIIIRYSERLYREGQWKCISPRGLRKKYHDHTRHKDKPICLLCSGAYVASDFSIVHAYPGKRLKWGYFTEFRKMTEEKAHNDKTELLWAGRFMKLKGAKQAVKAVKKLHEKGRNIHLTMIGDGETKESLQKMVQDNHLSDVVTFTGFLTPPEVREYMINSDIFLFTSNYREGWGAVLTEAMNSKCAVISSHAVGAAPFLIRDGINGYVYRSGRVSELAKYIDELVMNRERCKEMGENAYATIRDEWNPAVAAERVLQLCDDMKQGEIHFHESGPLSPARVIPPWRMYSMIKKKRKV